MENSLIILTIVQSILILALSGVIIFFGFHFFKNNQSKSDNNQSSLKKLKTTIPPTGYCQFHSQLKAEASCSICESLLCESCAKPYEKIHFCPEHFEVFKNHSWEVLETVKTTPDDTKGSEYLFKFKKSLWTEKNVPTYIQIHYQINVDDDTIISEIKLLCIKEDLEKYKLLIQNHKEGSITQ